MSTRLDDLQPEFRRIAVEVLAQLLEAGIAVAIVTTGRTQAEQDAAFARGASKVHHSRHQDGMAIDLCPFLTWELHGPDKLQWSAADPAFKMIGRIGEKCGLRWGGRFGESAPGAGDGWDAGHLELPVRT
jgi:hypothetical protein